MGVTDQPCRDQVGYFGRRAGSARAIGQDGNAELATRRVADIGEAPAAAVAEEGEVAEPLDDHGKAIAFAFDIAAEAVKPLRIERDVPQRFFGQDTALRKAKEQAGGIGRRIRLFRLPDENPIQSMTLSREIALRADRDNALYVKIVQEDGHQIWSSPIYIFR